MEKYSKLCLFLILTIFTINFISAQDIRFTAKQGEYLNIFERCEVNGFPCDNTFTCNITIRDSNKTIIVLNKLMTRNETIYNYSLNSNNTILLGEYEDDVCCTNISNGGCETFFHEITPSGSSRINAGEGSSLLGIFAVLILSIIFFLTLGVLTKNSGFKMFFISFAILLMVGTLGFGVTTMQQLFGTFSELIIGYGVFYRVLIVLLIGGALGLITYLLVIALNVFRMKRGLSGE